MKQSNNPYIDLLEAIIQQAQTDVSNGYKTTKDHKYWARDAENFLKSEYCADMQEIVNGWYHRKDDIPHISYNI